MNVKQVIASLPWLRRMWRFLPGPLRVPLLVVGAVVWLWRRRAGSPDVPPADGADGAAERDEAA